MESLFPIREISRLTGVNTVTLRAWERRYGLLKPQRTHKGHRLYSEEDIESVKKIQAWLGRGLAISKVSELLADVQQENNADIESIWSTYCTELLSIISTLDMGKLESFFNNIFSVYPADIIADYLISPVLDHLSGSKYGNSVKRAVLVNRLAEYLCMLIQRQRHESTGERIAIIQLSIQGNYLLNALLHYSLTANNYRSEYIGYVPANETIFLQENFLFDAIVVYNDSTLTLSDFQKSLLQLMKSTEKPIIVAGKLTSVLDSVFHDFPPNFYLIKSHNQQAILEKIRAVFSVGDSVK